MSSSAMAEWVEIGTTDKSTTDKSTTDKSTIYADPATIRKSANKVKMWSLYDFDSIHVVAGYEYLSSESQSEYDCKEEQSRLLYFSWHSENMGRGDVVYTETKPGVDWSPVAPRSVIETLWKFACGKLVVKNKP